MKVESVSAGHKFAVVNPSTFFVVNADYTSVTVGLRVWSVSRH